MSFRFLLSLMLALSVTSASTMAQQKAFFSVDADTDELVIGDPATGNISAIVPLGLDVKELDMTEAGGFFYAIDADFSSQQVQLLRMDWQTGDVELLGALAEGNDPVTYAKALATDVDGVLHIAYTTNSNSSFTTKIGTVDLLGQVSLLFDATVDIDAMATDEYGDLYGVQSTYDEINEVALNSFFLITPFIFLDSQISDFPIEDMFFTSGSHFLGISPDFLAEFDIDNLTSFEPEGVALNPPSDYQGILLFNVGPNNERYWEVGDIAPDFSAFRIASDGMPEPVSWYDQQFAEVDFHVVSTCAMWCSPCRDYANDAQTLVDFFATKGTTIQVYDWVFQDPAGDEPDQGDAMLWITNFWSADSLNVWYGGDLPGSFPAGVIENIFESNDPGAIPNILVLDSIFEIKGQLSGYSQPDLIDLLDSLTPLLGDVNLDGQVNLLDVGPFVEVLTSGNYQVEADCNQDGQVDLLDVAIFVELLGG